jgi:fructokinase
MTARTVVGLGELLWDLLPSGRQLGGAPANFAHCSHLLGNRGIVASRIGSDELGREARQAMTAHGLTDDFLQLDLQRPTSTVAVHVDARGQPKFEITDDVAWDFLEFTSSWKALAESADAVCFGSLAQRNPQSRATIVNFLDATGAGALRIFDVNLRQTFYSGDVITKSMGRAKIVKLNNEEMPVIAKLLSLKVAPHSFCSELIAKFDLELVCITYGDSGSLLCSRVETNQHPGFMVDVADTVGAGDAFTAGLVHEYLKGSSLEKINDSANRMGAWVASQRGAMPVPPKTGLAEILARQQSK